MAHLPRAARVGTSRCGGLPTAPEIGTRHASGARRSDGEEDTASCGGGSVRRGERDHARPGRGRGPAGRRGRPGREGREGAPQEDRRARRGGGGPTCPCREASGSPGDGRATAARDRARAGDRPARGALHGTRGPGLRGRAGAGAKEAGRGRACVIGGPGSGGRTSVPRRTRCDGDPPAAQGHHTHRRPDGAARRRPDDRIRGETRGAGSPDGLPPWRSGGGGEGRTGGRPGSPRRRCECRSSCEGRARRSPDRSTARVDAHGRRDGSSHPTRTEGAQTGHSLGRDRSRTADRARGRIGLTRAASQPRSTSGRTRRISWSRA